MNASEESEFEIVQRPQPDGTTRIHVGSKFRCLGAALPDAIGDMTEPGTLHATVTSPRRKVAAATWFLAQLRRCRRHQGGALLFLEAFLCELRASTFTLQFLFSHAEGFDAWYTSQQSAMREDQLLRWLVDSRNIAQKQGIILAEWRPHPIVRHHQSGSLEVVASETIFKIEGLDRAVSADDLQTMLGRVSHVVENAHERFFDPKSTAGTVNLMIEFTRERPDGTWEHFNPPG